MLVLRRNIATVIRNDDQHPVLGRYAAHVAMILRKPKRSSLPRRYPHPRRARHRQAFSSEIGRIQAFIDPNMSSHKLAYNKTDASMPHYRLAYNGYDVNIRST